GLHWNAVAKISSGGNWLAVHPASGTGATTLQVSARSGSLPEGTYHGVVEITSGDAPNSPFLVPVSLTVGLPVTVARDGVLNAASLVRGQAIAPNELLTIFGSNFTTACRTCRQAGDVQVTFDGLPAKVLSVARNRINLLTPAGLKAPTTTMVVNRG